MGLGRQPWDPQPAKEEMTLEKYRRPVVPRAVRSAASDLNTNMSIISLGANELKYSQTKKIKNNCL
jgi:hypothetical protein